MLDGIGVKNLFSLEMLDEVGVKKLFNLIC